MERVGQVVDKETFVKEVCGGPLQNWLRAGVRDVSV
jgi:hypothetical protein